VEFQGSNEVAGLRSRGDSATSTGWRALWREGFLPAPGRELPDVLVGMTGQPPEDVVDVGVRLHSQPFASDHEGEEIGGLLSP